MPEAVRTSEQGNALWFILIAIILLALLTSMMTRSGGSTNDTGEYERYSILANEILNYARNLENGYHMLLSRGCSENDISFEDDGSFVNPNSPSDYSCHMFFPQGAGLEYWDVTGIDQVYPSNVTTVGSFWDASVRSRWFFASHGMSHTDAGEPNVMDMHVQLSPLSDSLCKAINNIVGVTNTGGDVPDGSSQEQGGGGFTGNFGPTYNNRRFSNTAGGETANKLTGCVSIFYPGGSGGNGNTFYHHLNVR